MDDEKWLHLVFSKIEKDLDQIKSDIKEINQFRWKLVGASIVVSTLVTAAFNIATLLLRK